MKALLKQTPWLSSLLCAGLLLPAHGTPLDDEEAMIEYLQELDFEELTEVEVTLDEVFDVFDGLVKKRSVKVATGTEQSMARAPAVTTVITAQDIEAIGAKDLTQVLETVPGLFVTVNNFYDPQYTMRGNSQVLILLNGIRINNTYNGDTKELGHMPSVHTISRIEIIRGPGSAVYGADAFAGVINIITKKADEIQGTQVGIRTGSFDTQNAWILHGDTWGDFEVTAAFEYSTTDGHREIIESDAQTQLDGKFGTEASLAPGPINVGSDNYEARLDILRDNWLFSVNYHAVRDQGNALGYSRALDLFGSNTTDLFNANLTYHNPALTEYWDVTAQLSYQRTSWDLFQFVYPPGAFRGAFPDGMISNPVTSEQHSRFDLSGFYSRFNNHLIRTGSGYVYDDMYKTQHRANYIPGVEGPMLATGVGEPMLDRSDTPLVFLPETARQSWYLFLQDTWTLTPQWEITAGIRYDEYSDFGSTTNPRAAIVWQPCSNLTTKLLYGQAFMAPTFRQLFVQNNALNKGNPELDPEKIETWELALDYRATETWHLSFNLFRYDIEDKIIAAFDPKDSNTRFQNVAAWESEGVEFETRWKMSPRSSLLFNYAYQDTLDAQTNESVNTAPRHQAYLRTDWLLFPNWFLDTQINWAGDWGRPSDDPRDPVDDYTTVNLTLRYKDIHKGSWNFAIGVRNLFDEDVRQPGPLNVPNDYPLAGRSFFGEVRYQF
jgi:iron complex outermembrane receptor protein